MSLLPSKILNAAATLARSGGLRTVTRDAVASRAGVAQGSVNFHFETIDKLLDAVVVEAIRKEDLPIIAQALAERHPLTAGMPNALKKKVARHLTA